jgi:hypothetical protein
MIEQDWMPEQYKKTVKGIDALFNASREIS